METQDTVPGYHIWGIDNSAYGPIELPTLVNWIKDERVIYATWIYVERDKGWMKASEVPELKMFFKPKQTLDSKTSDASRSSAVKPGDLRRIKAFAEMADEQLSVLLTFIEIVHVTQFTHLLRKGDLGDAMYGVLEGELRSCVVVDEKEFPLATLGAGAMFGEISLFDKGPHAADVLANEDSVLAKITVSAVARICVEAPDVALPMVLGLINVVAGRVRTLTKRYEDSAQIAQGAEALQVA